MVRFLIQRIVGTVVVLLLVSIGTFVLLHTAPGGPTVMINPNLSPEDVERIRANLGLDQPLPVQYGRWLTTLLRGDLGTSLQFGASVRSLIGGRLPNTVYLGLVAFVVSAIFGILLGVVSALRPRSALDNVITAVAFAGFSLPPFWLGLTLILLFSVTLGVLPSSGIRPSDGSTGFLAVAKHFVMPVIVLGLLNLAEITRYTRSSMIEALRADFVRTARAKGLPAARVVFVHALRNSLLPVLTILGIVLTRLLGGTVVTETVFGWPGIGQLAIQAASTRDYPLMMGLTLVVAFLVIVLNLVVDLLYAVADPRVRRT
ncbi:MAG TPA: ABC transporter permease [Trueperaceae bacterium]|jgi:peptide/nickel transport system permease protein